MIRIEGQPILTAAQMRAAEDAAIAGGATVESLMERAGAGVADAVRRLAAGSPVLILCGPGNNGGDGYVAARVLKAAGVAVRVAATGEPKTEAAIAARKGWGGAVEAFSEVSPAPILVDAIFGTGVSREVEAAIGLRLGKLVGAARLSIAVDLPSGLGTDDGALLNPPLRAYDITLALGAVKPAHVLAHSAWHCGTVRIIDLGIDISRGGDMVLGPRCFETPGVDDTKYTRGMVAIISGAMPGAAALAAEATMRAGAGYVLLLGGKSPPGAPHALVRRGWSAEALEEKRIGCVLVGPGLGRDEAARAKLYAALASDHALVIDGDALHLLDGRTFHDRGQPVIVTPHAGEFAAMFGKPEGSKIEAARAAAAKSGATIVFKGPDTVIAEPGGHVTVAPGGSAWLSTAGTGDVLAGAVAAMAGYALGRGPRYWVGDAVWLHAEAARRLGGAFIADDLARELSAVRASL
ncbi:NAD(P)H-hydrate epimerase [Sphingomonas immobilis]|uniref:Bifunctional NAD(P)H-hydrate repair enzyme n=1 Tax=Sphingomonas immobilis TaxID=3063997 RepID=A0ABT8ZUM3_9SPHN|nr:NAD(P)H-hydrate epimerase [Sphingomonas sp. CA1-15]MDO7841276.1 NAD(P)H-hydrate epimerase [Sphingomonas sp. CA1-15]